MLDLFLYCDLASTHVSARGALNEETLADLVRMIDQLPNDSTVVVDLTQVSATDDPTLELLRDAITSRADTRSVFRVIDPLVTARPPVLGAA
jgi:ABC-type transporter Mla MlaB component